jgi:asparagine synthase (glutamine-hydrolysing)
METQIVLQGNARYAWHTYKNISFIGYFFDANNQLYTNLQAAEYIYMLMQKQSFSDIAPSIHGLFSIVCVESASIFVVTDRINFFPVFYYINKSNIYISDYWWRCVEQKQCFNPYTQVYPEFLSAGFVLHNNTLDADIYRTQAGEICSINERMQVHTDLYYQFIPGNFLSDSYPSLLAKTEYVFGEVEQRLVTYLNNRMAIVPLSGGYDSRLIACMLKRAKYPHVLCVTYGKQNKEVAVSKQVAEVLGFSWIFVDYDEVDVNYLQDSVFSAYAQYAGNGCVMPYLQEYFALQYLHNKQLIPKDSVFLPGHTGDFIAGSYVCKTVKTSCGSAKIPQYLQANYFANMHMTKQQKHIIAQRLQNTNTSWISHNGYYPSLETWDVQEKISKYTFHSSVVFPFFGYDVYFPLWDRHLVDFFAHIPYEYREHKKLYDEFAEEAMFKPLQVHFVNDFNKTSLWDIRVQNLKDTIRYVFPWKMQLYRITRADWIHYAHITKPMQQIIRTKTGKPLRQFKNFNAVISRWFLLFVEDSITKNK